MAIIDYLILIYKGIANIVDLHISAYVSLGSVIEFKYFDNVVAL